jgi:endonuclease-3
MTTKQERAAWIDGRLAELYPETPVPLDHTDAFSLLVAVLLSAQCTDKRVNLVTPHLWKLADTPEKMMHVPVAEIQCVIRPCGLSPQKAKAIAGLSRILVEKHSGAVPRTFEELEELPGVGHKTASVVMAQAWGVPAFPVDTHIHRLAQRWKLTNGKNVEQTEARFEEAVSARALECAAPADHFLRARALHGAWVRRHGVRDLPHRGARADAGGEDEEVVRRTEERSEIYAHSWPKGAQRAGTGGCSVGHELELPSSGSAVGVRTPFSRCGVADDCGEVRGGVVGDSALPCAGASDVDHRADAVFRRFGDGALDDASRVARAAKGAGQRKPPGVTREGGPDKGLTRLS